VNIFDGVGCVGLRCTWGDARKAIEPCGQKMLEKRLNVGFSDTCDGRIGQVLRFFEPALEFGEIALVVADGVRRRAGEFFFE